MHVAALKLRHSNQEAHAPQWAHQCRPERGEWFLVCLGVLGGISGSSLQIVSSLPWPSSPFVAASSVSCPSWLEAAKYPFVQPPRPSSILATCSRKSNRCLMASPDLLLPLPCLQARAGERFDAQATYAGSKNGHTCMPHRETLTNLLFCRQTRSP